jgi:hypothetical protein
MKYIRDAYSNNYHLVLLEDFNADMDNPKLHSQDKYLFSTLDNYNLFDTFSVKFDCLRNNFHIHHAPSSSSRIDYVWASVDVISNFSHCETVEVLPAFQTT